MLYLVRTLKEYNGERLNTDFVIETDNDHLIRQFFSEYKFVIVSLRPVPGRPKSAQFFGVLEYNNINFTFTIKAETLEEVIERCIILDLPLKTVNTTDHTRDENEIQKIIQQKLENKQERYLKELENQKKINTNIAQRLSDKKRQKIIDVITQTLKDINILKEKYASNTQSQQAFMKLKNIEGELNKMKMGSNIEKATTLLEETFDLMESIELKHITKLKEDTIESINEKSSISYLDITSELEALKRAQQTNKAGMKKDTGDLYYTYLGIVGLYQKFIAKDIANNIRKAKNIVAQIIIYMGFLLRTLLVSVSLFFSYGVITGSLSYSNLIALIILGIFNIVRIIPSKSKNKSLGRIVLALVISIILTISIYKIIEIYFALI